MKLGSLLIENKLALASLHRNLFVKTQRSAGGRDCDAIVLDLNTEPPVMALEPYELSIYEGHAIVGSVSTEEISKHAGGSMIFHNISTARGSSGSAPLSDNGLLCGMSYSSTGP